MPLGIVIIVQCSLVRAQMAQVVLVMPDTSPRGDGVPDEESGRSSHEPFEPLVFPKRLMIVPGSTHL